MNSGKLGEISKTEIMKYISSFSKLTRMTYLFIAHLKLFGWVFLESLFLIISCRLSCRVVVVTVIPLT